MTRVPKMRPGEGITGHGRRRARAGHDPARRASRPALQGRSRTCARSSTSRSSPCPILAKERLEGALNVRTREPREFTRGRDRAPDGDRGPGRAGDREREALRRARSAAWPSSRRSRGSPRRSPSRSTWRSRSRRSCETTMAAVDATGAALVLEDGRIAWPEGRPGAHAVRFPLRWKGRQIGELVCDRDTPVLGRRAKAARLDREPGGGRARARARGHARRPRAGDPPPRQEQPPDRRVAPAPAGALARGRRAQGARGLGQPDPRDRGRARGADRAARRRRRSRRARRAAARDARPGRRRRQDTSSRGVEPVSLQGAAGDRARARLLASSSRTRSSTAATRSQVELARRNGEVRLTVADDGAWRGSGRGRHGALDRARARPGRARAARSRSAGRADCAPRSSSPREDPDRRGRDDHPARPAPDARGRGVRGLRRGAQRRGGGRARRGASGPTWPSST